jgi:hypothetical protein
MRARGVTIITVALGQQNIDTNLIASSPQDQIKATDFTQLKDVHNLIINALCNAERH